MTATKIQPGDDLHLTLLMAPHSLNFVTGPDRAALLAFGRDVFAAARDSKCLAQIEEPAQPVAEICSASHDDAEFGERAIKPLCDISGFEYGTPLYAGAAPAAAAPRGEYPHEQMDAMALDRYKVVPSNASMLWSHAVVAGDGTQQLYVGREVECQNMARKFAGAFLDGAFAFHSTAAAPTAPAAPALEAPAAPAVPAGFALVPIEPTQQMLDAGRWSGAGSVSSQEVWDRMLATVTPPPAAYADDLVALVTELVQALRQAAPDNDLAGHALDYLKRNGLQGSPLLAAPAAPAVDAQGERDAAFEAVRNRLCSLQRYSFVLDDDGIVRRAHDRTGSWIEFDDAHALFDPVAVDAAIAAQAKEGGAPVADAAPLDVCTDPYNCARCKTHPAHRGDMHHAGISRIGGSA